MTRPWRDRITISSDARAAGSEVPAFTTTLATAVPCGITETKGEETYRGRSLEAGVDFVVEMGYSDDLATISATDQLAVTGGIYNGKTLNVIWPRIHRMKQGKPPMIELFCKEDNST